MSLNVKFGVSTWLWGSPFNEETIALFPKIKEMGFDAVEIPIDDPSLINVKKIKTALKFNALKPIICGAFSVHRDLTNDNPLYRKMGLTYITSCLNICQQLNTPFFCGPMYSAVGKSRQISDEQRKIEWARAVENLRKVCILAEERGLNIALEPLNRYESDLVNTAEDVIRLITDINHPAAKVLLDSFHMNIEEPDIEKAILLVGEKLIHLQVSENYRGIPGTGQTNWQAYYNSLNSINYSGIVSIESFTPNNRELAAAVFIWRKFTESQDEFANQGLQFLKKWAKS